CWGDDGDGELGNGAPTADQTVPDRVLKGDDTAAEDTDGINLINIKSISAGGNYSDMYTCAVSNSGNSYCWGYDYYGQLGNGDTVGDQTTPQRVEDGAAVSSEFDGVNLTNIKQIINGDNNSCVLSNIGNVYCWGSDSSGQLGDNQATTDRLTPIRVHDGAAVAEDTDGTYLINIKQITAGKWYVCALSNSGNTYCWGRDSYGQLGDNSTTTDRLTPIRVHDGAAVAADTDGTYLINMKEISAGEAHTCAISNSGNVYCWGDAYNGRLGDNQTGDDRLTPIRVHDGTDGNTQDADTDGEYLINMKSISAGYNYTCAISNASSTYCWGDVACGQLGDDQNGDDRLTPIRVHDGAAVAADTDGEYLINMKEISAGRYHTCAISNASSTYCWGDVGYGQLGDNSTTTDRHTPIRVHDGAATGADTDGTYLINMKSISAEYKYTCTVSNASSTYCWGESEHGRLGDNSTTTDRLTPVKVHDGAATGADTDGTYLINMQNISAGTLHACAISNSGNAYCWGDAYSGRLGDNQTATDRLTPVHTLRGMSNEDTSDIAKPFFTLNDTGTFGGDNPWSFTHLVFGNAHTTSTTTAAGTGLTTISRNLTIKENHILDAATKDWFLTGSGTPFVIDGTFTASTSHFKYTASSTTNIATTTYYNLSFLPTSGSPTYTIATGTIAITNDITIGDGTNAITLTANTTDATVDVGGVFTIATSSTYQASDTNDLTIAGNYTNSGTFTANSGTTTFDGTSQQTLGGAMTGANAFYTLKITNSSGSDPVTSPSVIFTSAASSTNFRAQTASTKIRFQESKGYSFVNFYLDGGATNTRVQLRSSIASTAWKLFVTGTQSVLNTNPQDSDASGGNEILANDGTSLDGTGNTHWDFGNATTTVVLNTADLEDFGTDTTPTLEFTGTDPDTDDVRYNIQIDTVDTFDNSDVDTYYFDASDDNPYDQQEVWTDDANVADGDTATTAYTSTLEDIGDNRLNFDGTNAPTTGLEITLVRARVYAYTETAGATDGVGFGISSGVETLVNWSAHDTTTTPAWSEYVVVSAPSGGWTWQKVNDLNTSLFKPDSGGNNTHVGRIEIEVTSVSLLDKLSGTDAGFANTASSTDTDPFTSAEKADYDVQPSDALASGTYYWRVRGLDPGGTNTYGDWSATQSFTIGGSDSLSFSISTSQSYFGTLVSGTPRFASSTAQGDPDEVVSHTLSASTTASSGYTITVRGDTLTSGVDTISAIGGTWASSSVDVEQFGLRITSSGGSGSVSSPYNGPDSYAYGATASVSSEIASTSGTSEDTTYSLYYITNAIANTDDGDYTATITYVITANF
ncbi:MAG: hypothetical protein KAR24_01255, partial [Candidatus Pacebacteria bacterium]|nr:hypothetical protein [Candidatus Paceibacterota bacterium]